MTDVPGGSKGVAFTNWLVHKAAGVLERKSSRRGFLIGSAMAGSAVAVAGCLPAVAPGSSYKHITDCAGQLCGDGYTEFCCTINDGINACPSGSFAGGWWRADYSTFCNGTRYYIDCMQFCCGPNLGNGFCAACAECRCAGGCDTRRVYCNYFRYGQCHQEVGITGPIACRVVTCTPPYQDASMACTTTLAVDNSTAEHAPAHGCAPMVPASVRVAPGAAAVNAPGQISVFTRFADLYIYSRTRVGGNWGAWSKIAPAVTSGITTASDSSGLYVIGRGVDNQIRYNKLVNGAWTGEAVLAGVTPTSNPVAVAHSTGVHVMVRGSDKAMRVGRFVNGKWSGWNILGGTVTSNPGAVATQWGVFLFARIADGTLACNRFDGSSWLGWSALGGAVTSDPTVVADATTVYAFARLSDGRIWCRRWSGGFLDWFSLGGSVDSDPVAVAGPDGMYVFVRASDGSVWLNRQQGGWTGFVPLGGVIDSDVTAVADASGVHAFARTHDSAIWTGTYAGGNWSGWNSLGGSSSPTNALS
jgi:hypothetical protein